MTADEKLDAVYDRLVSTVGDGPVMHEAIIDGWRLWMSTSDWGELSVSARRGNVFMMFTEYDGWQISSYNTTPSDLDLVADLASRAEWEDKLVGRRKEEKQ